MSPRSCTSHDCCSVPRLPQAKLGAVIRVVYKHFCNNSDIWPITSQANTAFREIREAINVNNGYILGTFSYADIAMAVACDTIEPLGPPLSK